MLLILLPLGSSNFDCNSHVGSTLSIFPWSRNWMRFFTLASWELVENELPYVLYENVWTHTHIHKYTHITLKRPWIYTHTMKFKWFTVERKKVKSLSCVQLFATPWTVAHQASPSLEFSRHEYWSRLPFPSPGDLPDLGIEPRSSALQADTLPSEPPGNLQSRRPV